MTPDARPPVPPPPRFGRRVAAAPEPSSSAPELEKAKPENQRRKQSRVELRRAITVAIDGQAMAGARLADLSPLGCNLVNAGADLREGQVVALKFAKFVEITGIVRWMRAGQTGIEFIRSLSVEQVTELAWND